jgi:hypothetical protein
MQHSVRRRVVIVILTFIAIALPFFVSGFVGEAALLDSRYLRFLNRNYWYRNFVPGGPRQTRIDEFKIVSLARNVEPGSALGENRCSHREFMAKLLTKLAEADPRLIVIDKWYGRIPAGVCAPGKDGTPALRNAIGAISAKAPLVMALGSYNRDEVLQFCPALRTEELHPDEVVLGDNESLTEGAPAGRVTLGLARINADIRKIPLGWLTFRDCAQVRRDSAKMWPTVATVAAELLDPNIMKGNNLTGLQRRSRHPYTKLVPQGTFEAISAIRLMCDKADPNVDWTQCSSGEGDKKALADLNHKVVIVGEIWIDLHRIDESVFTGPELQANYIASLLDGSILRPAPLWVNYSVSAAWLILMFWIFYGWKPELPELAVLVSAVMTLGLGVIFGSVVTRQWGVFADVVPPTIFEIMGLYLARRIEMAIESHSKPKKHG